MVQIETIRFEKLGRLRTFRSSELQARADNNPLSDARKQYRVWVAESEAAYLSFDIWPTELSLYEIFVAREFRDCGVGSECIRFAIKLATRLGKPRLTVRPGPLAEQSKEDLIAWYKRRGFTEVAGEPGHFEVCLG